MSFSVMFGAFCLVWDVGRRASVAPAAVAAVFVHGSDPGTAGDMSRRYRGAGCRAAQGGACNEAGAARREAGGAAAGGCRWGGHVSRREARHGAELSC